MSITTLSLNPMPNRVTPRSSPWLLSMAAHGVLLALLLSAGVSVVAPPSSSKALNIFLFAPVTPVAVKVSLRLPASVIVPRHDAPLHLRHSSSTLPTTAPKVFDAPAIRAERIPPPVIAQIALSLNVAGRPDAGFAAVIAPSKPSAPRNVPVSPVIFGSTQVATRPARASLNRASDHGAFSAIQIAAPRESRPNLEAPSSFGEALVASHSLVRTLLVPAVASSSPLEITFKPRPTYTPEARALKIEGDVMIQAVFLRTGEVRVLQVLHGLGHGLDESALSAASAVRFRPAEQAGIAVDVTGSLRIHFELAY